MTVVILDEAAEEIDSVQSSYELARTGLGDEYLIEFRRCINLILDHPNPGRLWTTSTEGIDSTDSRTGLSSLQ